MQDEARHVSYGTMHLKWVLDHRPERRETIHQILDIGENFIQGAFSDPANTEALIILAGKGLSKGNIEQGVEFTKLLTKQRIEEYFQRCARAGLTERPARSRLTELLHELFEVKSWLCAQMLDGAKMAEVFRKRALLKGYGLGKVSAPAEHFFKHLFEADSFSETCAAFYLLCGSLVLGVCRHGEFAAPTLTDKRIFRLVMQDVARLVAYGVAHLRYFLSHQPAKRDMLHESLEHSEALAAGFLGCPELLEPLIILSGEGKAAAGIAAVRTCIQDAVAEYFARCDTAGLEERGSRSKLAAFLHCLS